VLLNPLRYPGSDRLIVLDHAALGLNIPSGIGMSVGLYYQDLNRAHTLEGVALYRTEEDTITGRSVPERVRVVRSTPSLVSVLQVSPEAGRWFTEDEGKLGGLHVAVISHGLWMRRYGGNQGVLGESININGVPAEVVGIMPPLFDFPDSRVDIWVPEQTSPSMGFGFFEDQGVARLRPGVTLAAARNDLNNVISILPQAYPGYSTGIGYNLKLESRPETLKELRVGSVANTLWILLASAGLVLLLACSNVANLFLVRSDARQQDVAVRCALGANGSAIAKYFLSETALLALSGAALGLILASFAIGTVRALATVNLPRLDELSLDFVTILVTLIVALLMGFAFGAAPLLRRTATATWLQESGRSNTASRRRYIGRQILMGLQVALAFVLLATSGLMVRSFQKLQKVDPGFDPKSAVTFRIALQGNKYVNRQTLAQAHREILDGLSSLPGVSAVSATSCLPLDGKCYGNPLFAEGSARPANSLPPAVEFRAVAANFVEAMGMRLLRGRTLSPDEIERSVPKVVVNQALADVYFPNENPVGRRVASSSRDLIWLEIAGVVANTPVTAVAESKRSPILYMPMSIAGGPDIPKFNFVGPDITVMTYIMRSSTPQTTLMQSVRSMVDKVDPGLAVAQVRTLEEIMEAASAQTAFTMILVSLASAIALMLAAIGIYGVLSYIVVQRTREIGVRLALGAQPGSVATMIARQGGVVSLVGIVAGLVVALVSGQLLQSLLYGIGPRDPVILMVASGCLLFTALLACWLPARRAAHVDPIEAIRCS
jgi:predicted permease